VSAGRRGLVLLALAVACGGLAAMRVGKLERDVQARAGPGRPVVVAERGLAADARIPGAALRVAEVPARFAPPDALGSIAEAAGARTAVALPPGSYVTASGLQGTGSARRPAGELRPGERAVEVAVAGGAAIEQAPPGARVDVLVSSEPGGAGGRTALALAGVELLGLRALDGSSAEAEGAAARAGALATLRVTARQAVYLAAAENFAREVRLLVRPPGDRARGAGTVVGAGEL
jgi:pilus assembly protein CpaB